MRVGRYYGKPITNDEFIAKIHRLILDVPIYDDKLQRQQPSENVREKVLERGVCFLCNRVQKFPIVHHVIPNGFGEVNNLEPLCHTCHNWVHHMLRKFRDYP